MILAQSDGAVREAPGTGGAVGPHGGRSPLARKIITFNLIAILVLVVGTLYLNSSRDSLAYQRSNALHSEALLIAEVIEAKLPRGLPDAPFSARINIDELMAGLNLRGGIQIMVFDHAHTLVAAVTGPEPALPENGPKSTLLTDMLHSLWEGMNRLSGAFGGTENAGRNMPDIARELLPLAADQQTHVTHLNDAEGLKSFVVVTPLDYDNRRAGTLAVASAAGEIDRLVRAEREEILQIFVIAVLVSIGLSLVLASTIANPIADLAAAAEMGHARGSRSMGPSRIRIPDLTARPDEIGRLSGALRGLLATLYDRIENNEQFAADVAHEIKNPLASLRSAVGTLRVAPREDQREKLLKVIEHDVKRLDRLVSDISNASRLDSELVREEEEPFDLLHMLRNITTYLGGQAQEAGIDFTIDFPKDRVVIHGLQARLAQVFVNLITNAISFCEDGDAIRVWVRVRENRVLAVVEDTGPGIPEEALTKIFRRFYSERPEGQFGDNSGLGLAISKQIVEAHGGVIWAENILPTEADPLSGPLGARFVVGLPI
ncbi:two-component system, OmpR family, sensor histidine kinase ChvG [Poseidonocella pacifica]|uniref:histidine kinase n=1 Tax=Poseidonocella pacifica TaxID=871651 RepID=A0A1I0YL04_9RHOB|nr:sensor histidine kinase [Poseidonocella pacifica]SFB13130.1 two-component system, OmpR family, sensor histidine kinase ChvG [Poseidonocella pacifica]